MSYTKKTTALCRKCAGETKQIVRAGRSVPLSASFEETDEQGTHMREFRTDLPYELFECSSCEYIDLRSTEDFSAVTGFTVRFHPQLASRPVPGWRRDLPPVFSPILDELYVALKTESRTLATMGARVVVDLLLNDRVGEVTTYKGKLKAMEELGYIGARNCQFLWNALVGNACENRSYTPTLETLNQVMDIVEDTLHAVYIHKADSSRSIKEALSTRRQPTQAPTA